MAQVLLDEAAGTLRAREGGKWSATLLTVGEGSSGTYSEGLLQEYGATAFPKGTKLWWGHPKEGEGAGDRDGRDQWGVLEEDATYVPGEGLNGKIRLLPHWKDVVESLGDQASLSIYAMGESDDNGNVIKLHEHATNSIDIVGYPGRPGSGLKQKLEAARAASPKPGAASAPVSTTQEESMERKELEEIVEAIVTKHLTPITAFFANEDARRQAEADAAGQVDETSAAVEAAVAAVEAVKAAKVLPAFEAKLIESAKKGVDVTEDLEFAKKVTAESAAGKQDEGSQSFVIESATGGRKASFALSGGRR